MAWILRGHRHDLKLSVVGGFRLGRRDAAEGLEQTPIVVPIDPFKGGELNGLKRAPRSAPVDHLGLEQANHSFRQGIDAPIKVKRSKGPSWDPFWPGRDSQRSPVRQSA